MCSQMKTRLTAFFNKIKTKITIDNIKNTLKNFCIWYIDQYTLNLLRFFHLDMTDVEFVHKTTNLPIDELLVPEEDKLTLKEFRAQTTLKHRINYIFFTISYIFLVLTLSTIIISICNRILGITDMPERNIFQAKLLWYFYGPYYKFNYGKKVNFKARAMKNLIKFRYFKWNSYVYASHIGVVTFWFIVIYLIILDYITDYIAVDRWLRKNSNYYIGFFFGTITWVLFVVAISYNIYFFHLFFPHYRIGMVWD